MWQDTLELSRETIAEPGVVAHHPYHLAHDVERSEVGDEQYREPPDRAQHVIVQVGNSPLLQAEAYAERGLEMKRRRELDRTIHRLEMQVRRRPGRPGRPARGQLGHHVAWHSLHVGQFSTRRANTAAWNGFQAARTTPADTCSSASALLRTCAIATPRVKTIRRGSRASPGHRGNG